MRHKLVALTSTVLLAGATSAAASQQDAPDPYSKMNTAAKAYLDAKCSAPKLKAMRAKLATRIKQKLEDNELLREDTVMRDVMLNWAAGAQKRIKAKDPDAITQACFYFVLLDERGLRMPWQLRHKLTPKVCKDLTDYLYDLSTAFMKFYETCPVLRAETEEQKASRLKLCDLTARTLRLGLEQLGIRVVERM